MNMIAVESNHLQSIGYDPDTELLHVEFKDGGIYEYAGIPADLHAALMQATPSVGAFFHRHIKLKFKHRKVNPIRRMPYSQMPEKPIPPGATVVRLGFGREDET